MPVFKKITPTILVVLALLLPSLSFGGGNSGQQIVKQVYVDKNRAVQIWGESGAWANPDFCDSSDLIMFIPVDYVDPSVDNESYSEGYALIVASFLQGKVISGYLSTCDYPEGHTSSYPVLTGVSSYK